MDGGSRAPFITRWRPQSTFGYKAFDISHKVQSELIHIVVWAQFVFGKLVNKFKFIASKDTIVSLTVSVFNFFDLCGRYDRLCGVTDRSNRAVIVTSGYWWLSLLVACHSGPIRDTMNRYPELETVP